MVCGTASSFDAAAAYPEVAAVREKLVARDWHGIRQIVDGLSPIGRTTLLDIGAETPDVEHMLREVLEHDPGDSAAAAMLAYRLIDIGWELLQVEANGRSTGPAEQMALWRHGARDYGMPSYPEWGLPALTEDDLRDWVARYFTRDNAVLWVAGESVPAGLRLDLPDGVRRPHPAPSSALPVTPGWFPGSSGFWLGTP